MKYLHWLGNALPSSAKAPGGSSVGAVAQPQPCLVARSPESLPCGGFGAKERCWSRPTGGTSSPGLLEGLGSPLPLWQLTAEPSSLPACSSALPTGIWSSSARRCGRGALRILLRAPSHSCQPCRDLPFIFAAAEGILSSHLLQQGLFIRLGTAQGPPHGSCAPTLTVVTFPWSAVPCHQHPRGDTRGPQTPPGPGGMRQGADTAGRAGSASRATAHEFPGGADTEPHGPAEPHRTAGGYCSHVIYRDFCSNPWQSMITIDT